MDCPEPKLEGSERLYQSQWHWNLLATRPPATSQPWVQSTTSSFYRLQCAVARFPLTPYGWKWSYPQSTSHRKLNPVVCEMSMVTNIQISPWPISIIEYVTTVNTIWPKHAQNFRSSAATQPSLVLVISWHLLPYCTTQGDVLSYSYSTEGFELWLHNELAKVCVITQMPPSLDVSCMHSNQPLYRKTNLTTRPFASPSCWIRCQAPSRQRYKACTVTEIRSRIKLQFSLNVTQAAKPALPSSTASPLPAASDSIALYPAQLSTGSASPTVTPTTPYETVFHYRSFPCSAPNSLHDESHCMKPNQATIRTLTLPLPSSAMCSQPSVVSRPTDELQALP